MEGTSPRVKTGKDKPPWGWRGLHAAGQPGHSSSSCSPAPSTHRGWQRPVLSAGILCWPSSHRDNPREGDPGLAHVSSYGESSGAGVSRLYGYCESLRAPGSQDMQKPPESTTHRHIPAEALKENIPEWRSWVAWRRGEEKLKCSKSKFSLALKSSQ